MIGLLWRFIVDGAYIDDWQSFCHDIHIIMSTSNYWISELEEKHASYPHHMIWIAQGMILGINNV